MIPPSRWTGDPSAAERLRRDANTALHQGHGIAGRHGVMVTDRMAHGLPVIEIVREAESFDLIVVGSQGKGIPRRMAVGSVTVGVLSPLRRPLLVVPPPDEAGDRPLPG